VIARVNLDRADATTEKFAWKKFLGPALDLKIWGFALIFGMSTTLTYALAYFLPVILVENMHFTVGEAQCLIAPPYAAAAIWMYATGFLSDKWRLRGPIVLANATLSIIGLPIMGFASTPAVRYFGVFLTAMGANSNIPAAMTYQVSLALLN
jgi:MFS family permease